MDVDTERALSIVAAGLSRFFNEGHTAWDREQFEGLLDPPLELNDPALQQQLDAREAEGAIRGDPGTAYVQVVRPVKVAART